MSMNLGLWAGDLKFPLYQLTTEHSTFVYQNSTDIEKVRAYFAVLSTRWSEDQNSEETRIDDALLLLGHKVRLLLFLVEHKDARWTLS